MITVRKVTTIEVTADELKKTFYSAFVDILNDGLTDGIENFEMEANRLSDAMATINKHGFTPLFKEGYTMMLLPGKEFDVIEDFFGERQDENSDLIVRIVDAEGNCREVIQSADLIY